MTATKSGESDLENPESTSKRGKPTIVSSVFHGAEPCIRAQSLGRVRDPVRIAEGPTHDFGFSILDFGLRTEATRISLPEALERGEWFLVDSRHEHIEGMPLLVFVAHVVEGTLKGKR